MLGMGGLGIPVSGHSNHPRRCRHVGELSPTQISETSVTHCAAAREHLGPTGAALQLHSRRVHGPAVRGAVLNEAPGTTLEQVSSVDGAGVRQVKMTVMPGQEVTYYKNYASAFGQFARDSYLLFESTVAETTKVPTLLEMPTASMQTGLWRYNFGSLPAGPTVTDLWLDGKCLCVREAVVIRGSSAPQQGPPSGVSLTFVGSFPGMDQTRTAHLFQAQHIPPQTPQMLEISNPAQAREMAEVLTDMESEGICRNMQE
ncbi:hypothetical protein B0H19DRAFT_1066545 [Mycena capillaripes]|nr:hypothetical protein B0H19DRAFT_1066545 [Mycena capillaripes]